MRSLLLFLAAALPALASTVTCTGSDAAAIQASLNAGGVTTLVGSCNIGGTTLGTVASGTTLTTATGASVTYTGSGFALNINHNNVTVTNITWTGGGLHTTQTSIFTPQSGLFMSGNTFQNITMASANNIAILGDGYWSNVTISSNTFHNLTSVPLASISTSTNVENCTPTSICTHDQYPCSWSGGINNCFGSGIVNLNGLDNTTITFNHFDTVLGNAMSLKFDWTIGSVSGEFTQAANNNWSYNTGVNLHRMFEESGGGGSSCPGASAGPPPTNGCNYGQYSNITNFKVAGNFGTFIAPYGNTYGLSIPMNALAPQVINNTFDIITAGNPGFGYEEGNKNELFQGNVSGMNSGLTQWGTPNITANQALGYNVLQQNNIFYGPPGTLNGLYYGPEGPDSPVPPYGGTITNRFNINGGNCPNASNCAASTLATAFITSGSPSAGCTANAASFPTGGNGTWCFYATNQISIVNVQFFIDGSSTPTVTQEIQDLSSTFTSDSRWQYHATISTTGLSGGSHTILATATDVSGATSSKSQTFTTGSGPGASFSPASLAFGTITLGSSSSPQATTLTNTGTTTLTITGGVTITGANAGDFSKTTTCTASLASAATCTVTVTFTPTALGPRVAFVAITDNAAGSPHQVQLTGGASLCLSGNIISQCNFPNGPSSLVTGGGPWGFNGGSFATVAVDNTGPGASFAAHITVTAPISPGSNVELFQDGLTFPANGHMAQATLDCDASRPQLVNILGILSMSPFTSYGLAWMPTFPTSYGTHPNCSSPFFKVVGSPTAGSGRVTAQADNSTTGDQLYMTNVNVVDVGSVPASQLSAASVAFTPQAIGTTQTASAITITNGGIANLVISSISPSGDFGETNTCSTVTPGSTCTITPTFTPTISGSRIGSIAIASNDSSVSPQTIALSGTGSGTTEVNNINFPLVSHGSFSVAFNTLTNSTNDRIRYGTVPCSTAPTANNTNTWLQTNFLVNILSSYARLAVGGLAPNTLYYVCPEVSKDSGATWSSGTQAIVTTAPLPSIHPAMPLPPLDFNSDMPNTSGYFIDTSITTACTNTDFGNAYSAAITRWATQGTVIKIPHGAVCNAGPYTFNQYPPDVFKFTPSAISLPSTINWPNHGFSENDLVLLGRSYAGSVTYPASTSCDVGFGSVLGTGGIQSGMRYQVHVVDTSNIQIRCLPGTRVDPGITPALPPIMVFTDTGNIVGSQFFLAVPFKQTSTDANGNPIWERRLLTSPYNVTPYMIFESDGNLPPEHTQITPAWASQMFSFVDPVANIASGNPQHPFILFGDIDPNTEVPQGPIRFVGSEITTQDYNGSVHSSDPLFWNAVYGTYPWDSEIICDRCYYHMLGAPNREFIGWNWNGSNIGWLDSYSDNLTYYHAANTGLVLTQTDSTHFGITSGTAYTGFAPIVLPSNETVTIGGSGSGRIRAYFALLNSNAFTIATPSGITATCSPATCVNTASTSGTPAGRCNPTFKNSDPTGGNDYTENAADLWPKTANGEPTVGQIGCADVTSGAITTAGSANPGQSLWNSEGDSHMLGGTGPGPYKYWHNYSDGAGLTWHHDDGGNARWRGNYSWLRNWIEQNLKYMNGSSTSDGLFYFERQPLEWKGGHNILLKGNVFFGVWREDDPNNAFFAIQPLKGGQVTDVNFLSNTLIHGSAVLQGPTNTCGGGGGDPCSGPSIRIHLGNNLSIDVNGYVYSAHNPNGNNGVGLGWENQIQGLEDYTLSHNTFTPNLGGTPWILSMTQQALEGYSDTNSIHWFSGVPTQTATNFQDGSGGTDTPPGCGGTANFAFMNCSFTQGATTAFSWQNVVLGGYNDTSVPTGQSSVSAMTTAFGSLPNLYAATGTVAGTVAAVKWANPTSDNLANYHLSWNSPYNAGNNSLNHSGDMGADIDRLNADQGLVTLNGVTGVTTTAATVNYFAPDAQVCYVLYSSTNDITTTTQVADAGGARPRNVTISGLGTKTVIYYWAVCPGNSVLSQKSGSFRTN